MIRLTTPVHTFTFDVDPDATFEIIQISYAQVGKLILEKGKDDLTFATETVNSETVYTASLHLTQEETRRFLPTCPTVQVQVRALTPGGEALASAIQQIPLHDVLNDAILGE